MTITLALKIFEKFFPLLQRASLFSVSSLLLEVNLVCHSRPATLVGGRGDLLLGLIHVYPSLGISFYAEIATTSMSGKDSKRVFRTKRIIIFAVQKNNHIE